MASKITMNNNATLMYPLFRDYVALTNIGSGHYAQVYKSFSKVHAEVVAIKVFTLPYNSLRIYKINQEVTMMRKLSHNNIVKFIDFVEDDRFRYIVMEYCDQGTLKNLIDENKRLSECLTSYLLQQLVRGLNYLNSLSICHMDLKPENLLLNSTPHLNLKVCDFGLSHDFTDSTISLKPAGTIGYMAPEKILGLPYGLISDLWSVGVIIRECVTGKHIFAGYTMDNLRTKIITKSPIQDPKNIELSFCCIDLLKSLLQYEPNERLTLEELNAHPFVDLQHEICAESYQKAKEMVKNAIRFDENFEYSKSVPLYKEVLTFLQAFASLEPDKTKKASLNMKLWEYERWIRIIQKDPTKQHVVVVQPLPDLNGPWYEIKSDSSTSIPKNISVATAMGKPISQYLFYTINNAKVFFFCAIEVFFFKK